MNIDIMANNYINIDDRIEIAEVIDEEEIIAAVQEAPEEEEEGEDIGNLISNTVALDNIQNIFNYLQQNADIKINNSLISGMKNLQHQIRRKQNASLKQLTLESFYKK